MNRSTPTFPTPSIRIALRGLYAASILAASALAATTARAQARYSITEIGVLPGMASSIPTGINDQGDVVGYCAPANENFNEVAFAWQNGVIRGVGKLPKGLFSMASAINARGTIVGDGDDGDGRPLCWATGSSGLVNIMPNAGNAHAIGINDNGTVCGFYSKGLSGWISSWKPALWNVDRKDPRKYRLTDLPILVGPDPTFQGTSAFPASFNQAGQAAGYAMNEVIGQHACFWNSDSSHSIVDLGVYPGDWSSLAHGLNNLGQAVGESHPPFGSRPVLWENDAAHTPVALPLLPGDNYGVASSINDAGQALGTSAYAVPGTWNVGPTRLVIWRDGGVFELSSLLDASGAGWTLGSVSGINNAGQIIGVGAHNGVIRGFILTPVAP